MSNSFDLGTPLTPGYKVTNANTTDKQSRHSIIVDPPTKQTTELFRSELIDLCELTAKKECVSSFIADTNPLRINIVPPSPKVTRFDRIKTAIWNFLLPPHIRLEIKEDV
jgi:hypothetical protein